MTSKANLEYAARTDPFREATHRSMHIRRATQKEIADDKAAGNLLRLYRTDMKDAKGDLSDDDDRLYAQEDAACLSTYGDTTSIDSA